MDLVRSEVAGHSEGISLDWLIENHISLPKWSCTSRWGTKGSLWPPGSMMLRPYPVWVIIMRPGLGGACSSHFLTTGRIGSGQLLVCNVTFVRLQYHQSDRLTRSAPRAFSWRLFASRCVSWYSCWLQLPSTAVSRKIGRCPNRDQSLQYLILCGTRSYLNCICFEAFREIGK